MPQLFFTDLSALRRSVTIDDIVHGLSAETIATAGDLGLVDSMPFILGEDGSYDHDLNRFFRSGPTMGVRSLNSLRAYARDIVVWLRFLAERRDGKSVWAADRDDIAAFHEARRLSSPPHRIAASSWNRSIAALDKLYRWAVEENLIGKAPFTYRQMWVRGTDGSAVGVAANIGARTGRPEGRHSVPVAGPLSVVPRCGVARTASRWAGRLDLARPQWRTQRPVRRTAGDDRPAVAGGIERVADGAVTARPVS